MTCEDSGIYYLGNDLKDELLGSSVYDNDPILYKNPVDLKNNTIEWSYGSCKNKHYKPEGATYIHYPNEDVIKRVKEVMKGMKIQFEYDTISPEVTPLTVLMISVDSMSRKHFYRRLPKTHKFLQSLNPESFKVHDFKLYNIIGDNSIPNIYATLTGNIPFYHSSSTEEKNAQEEKDLIKEDAIWTDLHKTGWATLFGAEFCDNYFSHVIGRKPEVDHLLSKFWCAAEKLSGFNDKLEDQRCIGNKNSHFYMLNYTLQYVKNYQGINKWGHIMILPAHEDSGTVISTLDQDLVDFLSKVLETKDKIIIMLQGDHGIRYGNWRKTLEGSQEHKLPMLFTIISTDLLKEIPNSFDILDHNSQRLVTKLDIHQTLRHISYLPYFKNFARYSYYYNLWRAGLYNSHSLLLEKISDERTCDDAVIDKLWCSCNEFKKVDYYNNEEYVIEFFRRLAELERNIVWVLVLRILLVLNDWK